MSLVGRRVRGAKRLRFPEDLASVPVVLPSLQSNVRVAFDLLMEQAGIRPSILAEVDDMAMLRLFARESPGVTLVPPVVVQDELVARVLVERCRMPQIRESFYAITPSRRFPKPKIRERLAGYCAFAASADKARALLPTNDLDEALRRLAETSEAVQMLATRSDLTVGGARDIRASIDLANHGGLLTPQELLDIKSTLIAARNLSRTFERLQVQFPHLFEIAARLPPSLGLIDAITHAISERGEILDSASPKLATIRRDLRIVHDRLMTKLQRMLTDPKTAPLLQEGFCRAGFS